MDDMLNELLRLAQGQGTGMASVRIYWHPYERQWHAQADWADNSQMSATGAEPSEAVAALLHQLQE